MFLANRGKAGCKPVPADIELTGNLACLDFRQYQEIRLPHGMLMTQISLYAG